ncbi:pyridoxal phosphate-dependent aminotransferase [Rubritalea marina]|uniref:pyridoxal phosphate-dependent aminotransferase n=1 Tax=Rubritalea marina TaxID=361055 RepID=UPI0003807478|nr:pyridoxal phosphate-dependent aminotransferase [Rubritalea marina]
MSNKIEESASMVVAALANQLKADGVDVVSLSIGDTHFPLDRALQAGISEAMSTNRTHYSLAQGEMDLRNAVSRSYKGTYLSDEIIISHGVKNGLYSYFLATERQSVCAIEPAWLGYKGLCRLAGKNYYGVNRYQNNWLESLKDSEFDILIICNPNNPDGYVYRDSELQTILEIVKDKGAELLIDEIYKFFSYDHAVDSMARFRGLKNVVLFDGFSKSHAMTGLRVGYIASKNESLCQQIIKVQQNTITCVNTISQYGLSQINELDRVVSGYAAYYEKNRSLVSEIIPELLPFTPAGGFYYFFDLGLLGIKLDAKDFCTGLLEHEAVALIPGGAYGSGFDDYVRLSFCVDTEELKKGLNRLNSYIEKCKEL